MTTPTEGADHGSAHVVELTRLRAETQELRARLAIRTEDEEHLRAVMQRAVDVACGRVGGHLEDGCGCRVGNLDSQPSSERRRSEALSVLADALRAQQSSSSEAGRALTPLPALAKRLREAPTVKAWNTTTSAESSRMEIERMLRRYGAVGFAVNVDLTAHRVEVSFLVPDSYEPDAPHIPIKIPVSIGAVYRALYGDPDADGPDLRAKRWQQAERVAWRNLVLWIDASLSAAACGLAPLSEALMAHRLVADEDGRVERMADLARRAGGAIGPGHRLLITGGTT